MKVAGIMPSSKTGNKMEPVDIDSMKKAAEAVIALPGKKKKLVRETCKGSV